MKRIEPPGPEVTPAQIDRAWAELLDRTMLNQIIDEHNPSVLLGGKTLFEAEALTERDLSVGAVLREARTRDRVGVRELARRAGVEASRISRIESGQTARPDAEVITALALALGREPVALVKLASDQNDPAANADLWELDRALYDAFTTVCLDVTGDDSDEMLDLAVRKLARMRFLHDAPLARLISGSDGDESSVAALKEIVATWSSLTDERRKLVRAFVADQAELSNLDRRDQHGAPFTFRIELETRAS